MKMNAKQRAAHNAPIESEIATLFAARRTLVDRLYEVEDSNESEAIQADLRDLTAQSDALYSKLV